MADTIEYKAVAAVKAVTPDGSRFKATGTIDNVLDGTLVFVEYSHDVDVWNEKYVLVRGEKVEVIANSQALATAFSHGQSQPMIIRLLRIAGEPNILSAVIALLVIGSIIFIAIQTNSDPPQYLVNAFLLIVGFFFGTKTAK